MDPPSHYTLSDHWSSVPFSNIADRSTAPEPLPSTSQFIDPSPFSTFPSFNFLARSSNDLLGSNPFDVRHACNDPTERNEYQHMMTRDNLSRNTSMPVRPFPPCSACNNGQPRPTGPSNGLPNTHGRPERIDSLVCKWEHCQKPAFQSKGALIRHIDTQHIAPRSFKCPDQSCNRFFSRKDNMEEHVRRVHWVRV